MLAILLIPSNVFSGEPDKILHTKCLYPSVTIRPTHVGGNGSGIVIRSEKHGDKWLNVALTVAHIAKASDDFVVRVYNYSDWSTITGFKEYPALFYQIDYEKDTAVVLFASDKELHAADLGLESKFYIGNKITRVGSGMGEVPRVEFGIITSLNINTTPKVKNVIRFSAPTVPGDSGGGVYHENKLIAVIQAIRTFRLNFSYQHVHQMAYAVPINRYKKWSEELNNRLGFVFDKEVKLPVIPFFYLKMDDTEFNRELTPETFWD